MVVQASLSLVPIPTSAWWLEKEQPCGFSQNLRGVKVKDEGCERRQSCKSEEMGAIDSAGSRPLLQVSKSMDAGGYHLSLPYIPTWVHC
jgi:hypothetical protein